MHIYIQNTWVKAFITFSFLSIFCLMPVMAQDQQSTQDGKKSYNNDQLESFVIANAGIYQLQQQVTTQMSSMESDQQRQQLMQASNQQAEQILQNNGFTVDEYNTMSQDVQSDTQLQEKVQCQDVQSDTQLQEKVQSIASELSQQEEKQ